MVGEIETEQAGGLADVVTLHQQTFRLIDNVVVDVANSCATSCLVDDIAKITRRIGQFGGTPSDGWQALYQLTVLTKIGLKQVVKARYDYSIPVSGADSQAAHFSKTGSPRVSATLVASGSPVA